MPAPLLVRLREVLPWVELTQTYGMTESSAVLTLLSDADHRRSDRYLASVGRALPGVALSIRDPSGRALPDGEVGEICARGGNIMIGYLNQPEVTSEALRDGWYHSGDAGYLDAEGYLFIVDRLKDMIVSGGENVYCGEVEQAIASHPGVAEVAVFGLPSREWGEEVAAVIVPSAGASLGEADLKAHLRPRLAGYKIPKRVFFRSEPLPLSGTNKVRKLELREAYSAP